MYTLKVIAWYFAKVIAGTVLGIAALTYPWPPW